MTLLEKLIEADEFLDKYAAQALKLNVKYKDFFKGEESLNGQEVRMSIANMRDADSARLSYGVANKTIEINNYKDEWIKIIDEEAQRINIQRLFKKIDSITS